MSVLLACLTYLSAMMAAVPFLRPRALAATVLLWPLKVFAAALSPVLGLATGLGALLGLVRRDWKLVLAGALGAGLVVKFLRELPDPEPEFATAFGPDWQRGLPPSLAAHFLSQRWWSVESMPRGAIVHRDVAYAPDGGGAGRPQGTEPPPGGLAQRLRARLEERRERRLRLMGGGGPLVADVWEPAPATPRTGLAVLYVHGGGWRIGDKDMATRPFFQRLAAQGHVIMDMAYHLWPEADVPTMVAQVKGALLWLKAHAAAYRLDPERIVLMGGSAGAHLALLAAYTPDHPALPPLVPDGDTSVRGVVAYYPVVDFRELRDQFLPPDGQRRLGAGGRSLDGLAESLLSGLFMFDRKDVQPGTDLEDLFAPMLGAEPGEIAAAYCLLSPSSHVGPLCPPTLLLQGSDDTFRLALPVRHLHQALRGAGVPAVLVEFPHVDHGFDLALPHLSPVAKAATYAVERFLALLV